MRVPTCKGEARLDSFLAGVDEIIIRRGYCMGGRARSPRSPCRNSLDSVDETGPSTLSNIHIEPRPSKRQTAKELKSLEDFRHQVRKRDGTPDLRRTEEADYLSK